MWSTAVLIVLRELDVDITPVLTGAGIVGLAIGFGAQTLVRDVISGFFLIVEDQVRVGDVAMVNGTGGLVEQINLRTIVLRDFEGVVHVIPNGEIKTLANRTKDFSYYVIDLGIDYDEDTDRVMALVREAGESLMKDPGVRAVDSRSGGSARRRRLQGVGGVTAIPDQDHAAQAVGGGTRAAAAGQADPRSRRRPHSRAEDGRHHRAGPARGAASTHARRQGPARRIVLPFVTTCHAGVTIRYKSADLLILDCADNAAPILVVLGITQRSACVDYAEGTVFA